MRPYGKPLGVLWHSTGANNPWLKRYVQPSDNAPDRDHWLNLLGKNQNSNDWNHIDRQAGLNCWIGKLADGTVTTVQTMPWDWRPWGCGGSCNDAWVQFEICEDALTDPVYFEQAYHEACELTAYICKLYDINPRGTVSFKPRFCLVRVKNASTIAGRKIVTKLSTYVVQISLASPQETVGKYQCAISTTGTTGLAEQKQKISVVLIERY